MIPVVDSCDSGGGVKMGSNPEHLSCPAGPKRKMQKQWSPKLSFLLVGGFDWWFGVEPLVLLEGKWETPPSPPNHAPNHPNHPDGS